jgi:nitrate/TMAO reductase-like tetraheme cytochrome c subunit
VALGVGAFVAVPVADYTDRYFSSNNFCAFGCHVMEATVYKEFQEAKHYTTKTGVRPTCADCHVSEGLTAAMWDHVLGTKELYARVVRGIATPEDFEVERAAAADRVRFHMLANDSANCRGCHVMEAIQPERNRGQRQHEDALKNGTTCIACHYNLVHKEVEPSEAFLKAFDSQ